MRIGVEIEDLPGRAVTLVTGGLGQPVLEVDGETFKAKKKKFSVTRPGQVPLEISLKSRFIDTVPNLEVAGKIIELVPPLQWYQYLWCCLPILLVLGGGALGGALGGAASFTNVAVLRSRSGSQMGYVLTGLLSAAAYLVFMVLAVVLALLVGGG